MRTNVLDRRLHLAAGLVMGVLAGCGSPAPESTSARAGSAGTLNNGATLNGASLNGASLNGASLNGASLNGASLDGAFLDGIPLSGLALQGSALTAAGGLAGEDLAGAILQGVLSDGRMFSLRIDAVVAGSGASADVWRHEVSFLVDQGWLPLCGTDEAGIAVPAIALAGTWDYSVGTKTGGSRDDVPGFMTFACQGGALAKCADALGYKPWLGTVHADHHQACTRMMRADYCGDGRSHTVEAHPVNVYDEIDLQFDTESWPFEAEWDGNGARCIARTRGNPDGGEMPSCVKNRIKKTCGPDKRGSFPNHTLLMNESTLGEKEAS